MKKITSMFLALTMALSIVPTGFAEENASCGGFPKSERFIKVKVPYPDEIEEYKSWLVRARYADTKQPITLSQVYDGYVQATIPREYKDRKIEGFLPEPLEFTDIDDTNSDFHDIKMVSYTKVMMGNEKGEARIYDNITRAEAVTIIMRFLGLDNMSVQNSDFEFSDVNKNDWFYQAVMSAHKCGIVKGDSETTFSPNRNVTREEVVVMMANALKFANLKCGSYAEEEVADADSISDWAKSSYEYIGSSYITNMKTEIIYDEYDKTITLAKPQELATRADVAHLINRTESVCQMYPSDLAVEFGFDKKMPIIDGSTSTYPFTRAVYWSLFSQAEAHPDYPEKHSKSHVSYQRLINGEVDMIFASVYPASDILKMAEEKGVELELIPIAYDAMVFFTNKDNPIEGLTKEQITNIYVNDAYENWSELGGSDALFYPYCRNNDSGSHAQMEKHFLNGNEIHPEVQKETSMAMADILTDVIDAKTDEPVGYGLGYSIYYYYHNMFWFYPVEDELKLLKIDGVMPTDETIADGSYPLSNNTYLVLRKDTPADSPARKMAEFMLTPMGQNCVEQAGFGRLIKKTEISEDLPFADKLNMQMPEDKNYMFSPMSVKMALALSANGASGETQTEILNALGITNIDEFNAFSKDLIEKYQQTEILSLDAANSIWMNEDKTSQKFSTEFKEIATKNYNADVETVNNSNAVAKINSWVSDKTNGKIPTIVKDADFWSMLVNAIYFKGAWQDEFYESATAPDVFTNADGAEVTTDFMNKTKWFPYAETKSVQILELPYKNRFDKFDENGEYIGTEQYDDLNVSMYLMLADGDVNVEQELSAAIADEAFESKYVKLSMPKFKIEYSTRLNEMLMNMGIVAAFGENTAEFEKMFDKGNMWITDVIHKTYISVDEKGTEAAAVTAIAKAGSALPPEPLELKFNKPFYFVIRDNTSGETLFMGRYAYAE